MSSDLRQYAPTARRLGRLRQAGIFPRSQVLTGAAVFAALLLLVAVPAGPLIGILQGMFAEALGRAAAVQPGTVLSWAPFAQAGLVVGGSLVLLWLVAVGIGTLQRGGAAGTEGAGSVPLGAPQVSLHRSRASDLAWELVVSAAILVGGALIVYGRLPALLQLTGSGMSEIAGQLQQVIWAFAGRFGLLMVGLGLCDCLYQRAIFSQAAAMTRQELQQELRDTEVPWLVRWWQRQQRMRGR